MLETLNRYAHGLAAIPMIDALRSRGCLSRIERIGAFDVDDVIRECAGNAGYMEAALRVLLGLGWIRRVADTRYEATPDLSRACAIPERIMDLYGFRFDAFVEGRDVDALEPWLELSEQRWGCADELVADLLDGLLIAPLLLALRSGNRIEVVERRRGDASVPILRLRVRPSVRRAVHRLLSSKRWISRSGRLTQLTPAGRFVVDRIFVTATVASYRPMFASARELLFGDAALVFAPDADGREAHVDRTLNVVASGFQHQRYFAAMAALALPLFDAGDLAAQPRYIVDTGCGDGSLLRALYEFVRDHTSRGRALDEHPLVLVAADCSQKALDAAARTLAGLPFITVEGDIGDPMRLLAGLRAHGVVDLDRALHVRSFVDHNRPYREPMDRRAAERRGALGGSGLCLDADGHTIPPQDVIQSTVEHLRRWAPFLGGHGLMALEVHCLPPEVTAAYLDESESFHFDLYHALSHQYLIEPEIFLLCAAEAGLFSRQHHSERFSRTLPFTRITLHHFERRAYCIRQADAAAAGRAAGLEERWRPVDAAPPSDRREWFVLEIAGRIAAAVSCATATPRVTSIRSAPGASVDQLRDLVRFAAQYWTLKGRDLQGVDACLTALEPSSPPLACGVAREVAARIATYPLTDADDPRAGERELGRFAFRWLLTTLQQMGVMREAGEKYDVEDLARRLKVAPKYARYFEALMRRLAAEGFCTLRAGEVETTERVQSERLASIDEELERFRRRVERQYPTCVGLLNLTERCLTRYEDVVTGRIDIADVLFDQANMDVFTSVFRGDAVSDYFNGIVSDLVCGAVVRFGASDTVRILEIGAGTGGTSVDVLEKLQPLAARVEYCFTDISRAFLRNAQRRFETRYPGVTYRALNIEDDLARQGFAPHAFHVVVAANVLHDTRDIEFTLQQARDLLAPGGLLILNEYTSVKDCLSFSGALLHGWWLFEDPHRRLPDSCLLSVPQWAQAFEHSGLSLIEAFTLPTQSADADCGQSVMLCTADAEMPRRAVVSTSETSMAVPVVDDVQAESTDAIRAGIERDTRIILGDQRAAFYGDDRGLMEMGLDSIELVELRLLVERRFGVKLSPTFFFDHETPMKIAAALRPLVATDSLPSQSDVPAAPSESVTDENAIAVVGAACRLPGGAASPSGFWQLLERGQRVTGKPAAERWQWPASIDVDGTHKGIDRCGFLERIDMFDAAFFRISPREAELMDPQQRLLLELSWEALEDAGYRASTLVGRPVGVYVGACHFEYRDALASAGVRDAYLASGNAPSMLANRLSYFYDFRGPSISIDTACSSSLVALHDAVEAIRRGECEQALVGGVNLLCSPVNSVAYYQAGMLSPTGECRPFDAAANGFVRGEGGVVLLLKPLAAAVRDGDAIYGLIKSTAVKHGGHAISLTAPKPEAHATVVETAWREARVPAESIGYIEAHGTGTRLGDPVEMQGLGEAFRRLRDEPDGNGHPPTRCAVGSLKATIGHLEGAAGVAGLLKVLLSLQHRVIPSMPGFEHLNPEIDLRGGALHVADTSQPWAAPRDERGRELRRRAGVSSFGFGGANAHAVVEEYRPAAAESARARGPWLIPLSAATAAQLTAAARALLSHIQRTGPARLALDDVAFTLQVGREPMQERVAFVVRTPEELATALEAWVSGGTVSGVYRGQANASRPAAVRRRDNEDVPLALGRKDLATLARLWVDGVDVDWSALHPNSKRRAHLPTYPFARERYWIPRAATPPSVTARDARLHPLLHRNTSDLREQRFTSSFTADDPAVGDYRIAERCVLPAVVHLEMARAAVALASDDLSGQRLRLERVHWLRPLELQPDPMDVHIALHRDPGGAIDFEVYGGGSEPDDDAIVYARGVALLAPPREPSPLDVSAIAARYHRSTHTAEECYAAFRSRGAVFGPTWKGLEGVSVDSDEVIARIALADDRAGDDVILTPAVVNSALQALIGFSLNDADADHVDIPVEVDAVEIYGACVARMWVVGRRRAVSGHIVCYDIDLCDESGRVALQLRGVRMVRVARGGELMAEVGPADALPFLAAADARCTEMQAVIAKAVSTVLLHPIDRIRPDVVFSDLGVDSLGIAELTEQLEAECGVQLTPTIFYQHPTLERLARHLVEAHGDALAVRLPSARQAAREPDTIRASAMASSDRSTSRPTRRAREQRSRPVSSASAQPIAIVGMSARFPGGLDLEAFWANLVEGRDCVAEIPADRWDWRTVYGGPNEPNKTSVKWGGFIDGVDEFEPLFFNISPREAELMDPQQRLLLIHMWKAIEDAGYAPSSLSGTDTAVFTACGLSDYSHIVARSGLAIEGYTATGTVASVGANRLSYFLNLRGPSEPIETLCSSSLVAIHRAVGALRTGQCTAAIVGGVNTILTPDLHISCTKAGMLSPEGRCKPFSDRADGYARGEGVAALLLKPLAAAEAAGDHIYGVIRGTAENHGGRATSFSAPNPQAQAELLCAAYTDADVAPASVSYIEAHGTGTALGDPIEVEGLQLAFAELHRRRGTTAAVASCGLGSVKSNIGHLELAAGMAGVIKVLLQLQHDVLVPTLHCGTLNPYLRLEGSPFYVVREPHAWPRSAAAPRRAGVSAFGFGGVNAHVVLEEYVAPAAVTARAAGPVIVVLSAHDGTRLQEQVAQLLAAVHQGRVTDADLPALAYTLQVGREAMAERVGLLVTTRADLQAGLQAVLDGRAAAGVYRGQARAADDVLALLTTDGDFREVVARWIEQGRADKLVELWTKGVALDWAGLYRDGTPRRLSLPTYPFARQRCWVPTAAASSQGADRLHPLLHQNTSDLADLRFSSAFTGSETFLADHRIRGERWLPAVAYLEMAREAAARVSDVTSDRPTSAIVALENVVWLRPIVCGSDPLGVHIALTASGKDIGFDIYTGSADDCSSALVHAQGVAVMGTPGTPPQIDLAGLSSVRGARTYAAADCYRAFEALGIQFGPGHRCIEALQVADDRVLATLTLPEAAVTAADRYVLHPSLMDAALQAMVGFFLAEGGGQLGFPFELQALELYGRTQPRMLAVVRRRDHRNADNRIVRFDIDLCDEAGLVVARMRGLSTRPAERDLLVDAPATVAPQPSAPSPGTLQHDVQTMLTREVTQLLKLQLESVRIDVEWYALGFDSITLAEFAELLNDRYGLALTPTIFFQYPTLARFASHLLQIHPHVLTATATPPSSPVAMRSTTTGRTRRRRARSEQFEEAASTTMPIAIVGMSGRFPGGPDLEAFWTTLVEGRDGMVEIPPERWDWRAVHGSADEPNKTNVKWGAFIDGVDEFDPSFFAVSRRAADVMDPQQRLLLIHVWKAIEDAGYAPSSLSGTATAVYVATGLSDYARLIAQANVPVEGHTGIGTFASSIVANQISYFLNLRGPSEPIETLCSSSLVAIHRAVGALRTGQCTAAIVGGVNTILTPDLHISCTKAGMLSPEGRCKPFSDRADGYARGEGVAALLLKPLAAAEAAGDHIYGVIRGTAENHGGRATSFSAPNPQAQAELLCAAYTDADVAPASVSYIEAHGTGTALGDPIEVEGLQLAFAELHRRRGTTAAVASCGLGSVKSNIGHLELAAGMAGVIKVLLQLQHDVLVPTLHCGTLNPYLRLEGSPFYVVREPHAWPRAAAPRRAGVSAFGFGGVNAHVVLEEYVAPAAVTARAAGPVIVVLSAHDGTRLQEQVAQLLAAVHQGRFTDADLPALAYTLQVGREAMAERVGLLVTTRADLQAGLQAVLDGRAAAGVYRGQARAADDVLALLTTDGDFREVVARWIEQGRADKLVELWTKGVALDWAGLYRDGTPRRLSLPTYPFARLRCWVPTAPATGDRTASTSPTRRSDALSVVTLSTTLSGRESYLTDHAVHGRSLLPAVVYLEMAREAVSRTCGAPLLGGDAPRGTIRLNGVVWARPCYADSQAVRLDLRLESHLDGEMTFEVASPGADAGTAVIHARGRAAVVGTAPAPVIDIPSMLARCTRRRYSAAACYAAFADLGCDYGPAQRGLVEVALGDNELVAQLAAPATPDDGQHPFVLHPGLADSALQATIAFLLGDESQARLQMAVPFELDAVEIFGPCRASMWAAIRRHDDVFDIDLCDERGAVAARFRGWRMRALSGDAGAVRPLASSNPARASGELLLTPIWDAVPLEPSAPIAVSPSPGPLAIIGGSDERIAAIRRLCPDAERVSLSPHDGIGAIEAALSRHRQARLLWIVPSSTDRHFADDAVIADQDGGLLFGFRLIKALGAAGFGDAPLTLSVATTATFAIDADDHADPTHAGLAGLLGSASREYPQWTLRLFDMPLAAEWPWAEMLAERGPSTGEVLAYRQRRWYSEQLVAYRPSTDIAPIERPGDVYVMIGGAGGIASAWSEALLRRCPVQIVWIGRRPKDDALQARLDALAALGPAPVYLSLDATDRAQLSAARASILERFGRIDGIVHAALVLRDRTLATMTEDDFRAGLAPKVDVAVRLAQVFGRDPLRFVLFFSSFNSFFRSAGQSNYVAGCTFQDAFARRLATEWPCRVRVVNWGYWGSVGAVASERYRTRLLQRGFGSIEIADGVRVVDQLVGGAVQQLGYVKVTKPDALAGLNVRSNEWLTHVAGPEQPAAPARPVAVPRTEEWWPSTEWFETKQEIDRLVADRLWTQLRSMPGDSESIPSAREWRLRLGIQEQHERWLSHTIDLFRALGYLADSAAGHMVSPSAPSDAGQVEQKWRTAVARWTEDADWQGSVQLADATLQRLPEILTGRCAATDILFADLFPDVTASLVGRALRGGPVARVCNSVLATAVRQYVEDRRRLEPQRRVRILEIGAGTGSTTEAVLAALERLDDAAEYTFTDLSRKFLVLAGRSWPARSSSLRYDTLDIERPMAEQLGVGRYDIVIASNVLHATADIPSAIRNAKAALSADGLLLLIELTESSLLHHVTFGLLEGWWRFRDPGLRIAGGPALHPDTWREVLRREGFRSVQFPVAGAHELGQQVVVAQSDGVIRQCERVRDAVPDHAAAPPPAPIDDGAEAARGRVGLTDESREAALQQLLRIVRAQVAETLGVDAATLDTPDRPFVDALLGEFGMDSLSVTDLRNALRRTLGADIPAQQLLGENVAWIVEALYEQQLVQQLRRGTQDVDEGARETFVF